VDYVTLWCITAGKGSPGGFDYLAQHDPLWEKAPPKSKSITPGASALTPAVYASRLDSAIIPNWQISRRVAKALGPTRTRALTESLNGAAEVLGEG
jgi:hypothetical protein